MCEEDNSCGTTADSTGFWFIGLDKFSLELVKEALQPQGCDESDKCGRGFKISGSEELFFQI